MTDVFISYKREDRERCAAVAEALRQLELAVWFDAQIEPGMTFDREIERELKRAQAVLVLWSARSVDSDWVRNEARVGRAADKLVAVKLDECDLPLEFMASQVALLPELDRNAEWFSVIGRIGRLVERPGLLPFVKAQGAGRAEAWQDWLARYAGDPLADKARRYLAALGAPMPEVQPEPQLMPRPVAEPILQADPAPISVAEPVAAPSRLPLLVGGVLGGVALFALGVALWPNRSEPDPAPAPVASASGPVTEGEAASATVEAAPAAGDDVPVASLDTAPATPAPVAAPTQPSAQAMAEQPAPTANCEAGPYVVPLSADPNANLAEGQAVLGAAAQAYQRGCQGRVIRIRGVAESGPEAMQAMRRRANAVATWLAGQGLPRDRMEITVVDQARARGGGGQRIAVTFGG